MPVSQRRGFTLIELLVVISIIALMISILLPVFKATRSEARAIQCLASVRSLAQAQYIYLTDSNGRFQEFTLFQPQSYKGFWYRLLSDAYQGVDEARFCPESTIPADITKPIWGGWAFTPAEQWDLEPAVLGFNPETNTWYSGSYAFNGWLYNSQSVGWTSPTPSNHFNTLAGVDKPSQTPAFGDSYWIDGLPLATDVPTVTTTNGGTVGGQMNRWAIPRHKNQSMNMSFIDGSARRLRLPELWQQNWHKAFVASDVVVPDQGWNP